MALVGNAEHPRADGGTHRCRQPKPSAWASSWRRAQAELEKTRGRLANENFVRDAPPAVVAAERERAAELERTVGGLAAQLERVRGLGAP